MYKEMAICFITVVLIISLNFITTKYTEESVCEISDELMELEKQIDNENKKIDENKEKVNEIFDIWKMRYDVLTLYLEHDELEKVETNLNEIKGNIETEEYNDAISEIEKTVFILKHIEEKNKFDLRNVF